MASRLQAFWDRIRVQEDEHQRRMLTEPAYRLQVEEGRKAEEEREKNQGQEVDRQLRRGRMERGGVPARVMPLMDEPEATQAVQAVIRFLHPDNPRTLLVLAGGVGTGKTVAACWAIGHDGGKFEKAIELVRHGLFEPEYWEGLKRAQLLVVDDLGTEPRDEKGYAAANLDALLDYRYDAQRPTILTTNLAKPDFELRYCAGTGIRTLDRLKEVGTFVGLSGGSMRKPFAVAQ